MAAKGTPRATTRVKSSPALTALRAEIAFVRIWAKHSTDDSIQACRIAVEHPGVVARLEASLAGGWRPTGSTYWHPTDEDIVLIHFHFAPPANAPATLVERSFVVSVDLAGGRVTALSGPVVGPLDIEEVERGDEFDDVNEVAGQDVADERSEAESLEPVTFGKSPARRGRPSARARELDQALETFAKQRGMPSFSAAAVRSPRQVVRGGRVITVT